MTKFGFAVCIFLLGLAVTHSLDVEDENIVRYCEPSPQVRLNRRPQLSTVYDTPITKCVWTDNAPAGHQVRFVCREVLKPDEQCKVDSALLKRAALYGLHDFACGKKYFSLFSNGPVLKLNLNSEDTHRTFRCDLEAVPDDQATCNCKLNADSDDYSWLAAVLTTKLEKVKCPGGPSDTQYHLASGFCEINLTNDEIAAYQAAGDSVISLPRRSKFVPANAYRVDYDITLAAVQNNDDLNLNVIPLCLQGGFSAKDFQGEIVTITSSSLEEGSEVQSMEVKRLSQSQCSSHRVTTSLVDGQICSLDLDIGHNDLE